MVIKYTHNDEYKYFISKYTDAITDTSIFNCYKDFYEEGAWKPGYNELVDASECDLSNLTGSGMIRLNGYIESLYKSHNIINVKTAIYAPHDLPFGIGRMYEAYADESPEHVQVFRDLSKAIKWLQGDEA